MRVGALALPSSKQSLIDHIDCFTLPQLPSFSTEYDCDIEKLIVSNQNLMEGPTIKLFFNATGQIQQADIDEETAEDDDSSIFDQLSDNEVEDASETITQDELRLLKTRVECFRAACETVTDKLFFAVRMKQDKGDLLLLDILESEQKKTNDFNIYSFRDKYKNNCTLMHVAAMNNNTKCMQILCDFGFLDLDIKDKVEGTPLHYTCINNAPEALAFLLTTGLVKVNTKDFYGAFGLLLALRNGHFNIMKLLLMFGADPQLKNEQGDTMLHYQCKQLLQTNAINSQDSSESLRKIHFLMTECQQSLLRLNRASENALFCAVGNDIIVQYLCTHSNYETFSKMLIQQNSHGKTVFQVCCENGHLQSLMIIMKMYVEKYRLENKEHNYSTKRNLINYLSQRLNEPSQRDGYTSLHLAVRNNHQELTRFFLSCMEIKVNVQDTISKKTPLQHAVHQQNQDIVDLFVAANLLFQLENDITPTDSISEHGRSSSSLRKRRLSSGTIITDPSLMEKVEALLEKHSRKSNILTKLSGIRVRKSKSLDSPRRSVNNNL
jgi:ankyrin repeat protein